MAGTKMPADNQQWVQDTLGKDRTVFMDLLVSSFGTLVSGFATPIRSRSGDTVGVLRGVIVVSEDNTVLSTVRNTKQGRNGYAYIVTSNGWLLAHPKIQLAPNDFSFYNYMNFEPVKRVVRGQAGRCEYEYDGAIWVAAYRPIKATGWGLVVHQPKADLLDEAHSKARTISRLFIIAFLVSALVLVALIHFELRPLSDLLADIRAGNSETRRAYGKGEIGQLAHEFRRLYASLLQSNDALQESEEHFRLLLENDHSVMLLVEPETGNIVDANPAACRFYGYSKPHLTSKKITQLDVAPEADVLANMKRLKTKPESHHVCQHRLAGGEVREVEVYTGAVRMRGQALLHTIVHDITERKRAEDERRKLEAQM
jgi:PAS domain S-box-containing protein